MVERKRKDTRKKGDKGRRRDTRDSHKLSVVLLFVRCVSLITIEI